MKVLIFHKPTWSSNRGSKWHRPRILRAWNRWSGPVIEPWTHKRIMPQGQGIEPWTHKIDRVQGQGFEPWTYQKDRAIVHTIAHMIMRAIVKINVPTKSRADARTSSTWNVSTGRRTMARSTDDGQTVRIFWSWKKIQDICFHTKSV